MTTPYLAEFEDLFERATRMAEAGGVSVTEVLDRFLYFAQSQAAPPPFNLSSEDLDDFPGLDETADMLTD